MSTTRPVTLPTPPPPTAPGGMALAVPTAEPCADCGTTGGYIGPTNVVPERKRGLCLECYNRHYRAGTYTDFALTDRTRDPEGFTGFPEGYTHEPTGWPIVPALVAPLHPTLPAPSRWGTVIWFRRPQHDPVGQRLFDAETRYEQEAA